MAGEPEDTVCRICMHQISQATSIKGCNHGFCYQCLQQWTSSRRTPLCPICRCCITMLVLADGTEEEAKACTAAESEEVDLSCLDHNYFLGEVSRLLSRANTVHNRLYAEAYSCGRKGGSRQTERCLDSIQDMLGVLGSYKDSLEDELRFDPEVLLQDLYRLDRQLASVQSEAAHGGSHSAAAAAVAEQQQQQQQQHVEHEWHDNDHYEDDYDGCWPADDDVDDDDWHHHAGLSKTPGRRPTSRRVQRGT